MRPATSRSGSQATGAIPGQGEKPAQYPRGLERRQQYRETETPQDTGYYGAIQCGAKYLSGGHGTRTNRQNGPSGNDLGRQPLRSDAFSDAFGDETGTVDPDLAEVIVALPHLPDTAREEVLRIVAEARQGGEVGSP